jgi:hypothetical protein
MKSQAPPVMPNFCNRRFPFHFTTALMTLMKMGIDINRVDILAAGKHQNYRGEIWEQEPKPGTLLDENTGITLTTGFASAVDYMPYQFFYGLEGVRESTGEWETQARKLMASFDAAIVRRLARADYHGMKYNLGLIDIEHITRFLGLFGFDLANNTEDLREAMIWAALFPSFHFWAGNPAHVARILRCIFGYEFRITENIEGRYDIPGDLCYRLGNGSERLGQGTVLGRSFVERDSRYRVEVIGVDPDDVPNFLIGKSRLEKLRRTLEICMPGYLDYEIRVKPKTRGYRLGKSANSGYLGYTTYT